MWSRILLYFYRTAINTPKLLVYLHTTYSCRLLNFILNNNPVILAGIVMHVFMHRVIYLWVRVHAMSVSPPSGYHNFTFNTWSQINFVFHTRRFLATLGKDFLYMNVYCSKLPKITEHFSKTLFKFVDKYLTFRKMLRVIFIGVFLNNVLIQTSQNNHGICIW